MMTHKQTTTVSTLARYRTIWISDVHLGMADCKAHYLLSFLRQHECEFLYLVGDIVDGYELSRSWSWPKTHNFIIHELLRKSRRGTEIFYIPGNHDTFLRAYTNQKIAGATVVKNAMHTTVDGKRLLVMHGDEFDGKHKCAKHLVYVFDRAYYLLMFVNRWVNVIRYKFRKPYWSLSAYAKKQVRIIRDYISRFEHALADAAVRRQLDGVISGHIHVPAMKLINGILYCNAGDWLESCTMIAEDYRGRLHLIEWRQDHLGEFRQRILARSPQFEAEAPVILSPAT
jgi:UDP-2,3-diacylglucosamine pyrophosphatase LpxH